MAALHLHPTFPKDDDESDPELLSERSIPREIFGR
jgi:hypothetical protein